MHIIVEPALLVVVEFILFVEYPDRLQRKKKSSLHLQRESIAYRRVEL